MESIRLFSNCKITVGYIRNIIVDLEIGRFYFCPKNIRQSLNSVGNNYFDQPSLYDNREFLLRNNLAFISSPLFNLKISVSRKVMCFSKISNCTVLINRANINVNELSKIIEILCSFGTVSLLLIFSPEVDIHGIKFVLNFFNDSKIRNIVIISKYTEDIDMQSDDLIFMNYRLTLCKFYEVPNNLLDSFTPTLLDKLYTNISYAHLFCQPITINHFVCNFTFYNESLNFNPFYYKKLIVDISGNIYSNYDFTKPVASVYNNNLLDTIYNKKYFEYVFVDKNKIDVCKNCEFKNICPDNRIPNKRANNSWFHTVECNYNPYIAKWSNEEGYLSLTECGVYSSKEGFKIDKRKLNKIIATLWQ